MPYRFTWAITTATTAATALEPVWIRVRGGDAGREEYLRGGVDKLGGAQAGLVSSASSLHEPRLSRELDVAQAIAVKDHTRHVVGRFTNGASCHTKCLCQTCGRRVQKRRRICGRLGDKGRDSPAVRHSQARYQGERHPQLSTGKIVKAYTSNPGVAT
jgi:hypothetical protein